MRVRDFERTLAALSPWTESDLDQRSRRLRDARMLPQGGRGPNAPHVAPGHVATMLIGLGASEKAVNAVAAVTTYAPMVRRDADAPAWDDTTFGARLEELLSSYEAAATVASIVVYQTRPQADINLTDGSTETYRPADAPSQGYGAGAFVAVTFMPSLLTQLAHDLTEANDADDMAMRGGWVADLPGGLPKPPTP